MQMEEATWRVSADDSLQAVLDDPACPPLLSRVLRAVHSWQVRNETTVGRTLRASQLMPQWTAALLALGATATVERDEDAEVMKLEDLVQGRVEGTPTFLQAPQRDNSHWGEARVARTPSDDPIVAAMAVVKFADGVVEDARVALTGVSSQPVWLADAVDRLLGRALDLEQIEMVASAVADEVQPQGDYLGSEEYRRALAGVLTRRALESCLEQEAGDE